MELTELVGLLSGRDSSSFGGSTIVAGVSVSDSLITLLDCGAGVEVISDDGATFAAFSDPADDGVCTSFDAGACSFLSE